MFEDIQKHRQAVRENIEKSLQIGFTESEDFEKAHQVGDIHPNGKWVWTQLPSGKFDWRVIKNKQGDNSAKNSSRKFSLKSIGAPAELSLVHSQNSFSSPFITSKDLSGLPFDKGIEMSINF